MPMRVFLCLSTLILSSAWVVLAGCDRRESREEPQPVVPRAQIWPSAKDTDRGSFTVTVDPGAGKIVRGEHFSLSVSINVKAGVEPGGVTIDVHADMPAHRHGMNTKPEIVAEESLRCRVDGMLFHMAGDWVIEVEVFSDGEVERASFPVYVE